MRISIQTYGNTVTVDGESHVVDKNLSAMFPGVAAIHYDHETGIGHVEYTPTPPHTFYGMDGLKGLSDVLKTWNDESAMLQRHMKQRLDHLDKSLAKIDPKEDPEAYEEQKRARDEFAAKVAEASTPEDTRAEKKQSEEDAQRIAERAPVVIEDF